MYEHDHEALESNTHSRERVEDNTGIDYDQRTSLPKSSS